MRNVVVKILNIFAKAIQAKYKPVVIGVTGSVGKSSTCQVIGEILQTKYSVRFNNSAYRTDISVPLAIIGADSGKQSVMGWVRIFKKAMLLVFKKSHFYPDILILEMGVDRPGDMEKMLKVVHPNIAVCTSLGEFPAHIQYFKSAKSVVREKALLFKSLVKKDLAVLNFDDVEIKKMAEGVRAQKTYFGFADEAMVKGEEIFLGDTKWKIESGKIGMSFKITNEGTVTPFRFSYALGRGQVYAALAGTAVALYLGFNMVEIAEALEGHVALPGRMNLIKGLGGSLIIDDSFNASPSSFFSALETIKKLDAERKIVVLSDMRELGVSSEEAHRNVSKLVMETADIVFVFDKGEKYFSRFIKEAGAEEERVFCFESQRELIENLRSYLRQGDIVLVKGARKEKMEKVVKGIMLEPDLAEKLLVKY